MTAAFEYHSLPRIVFGRGQVSRAGEIIGRFGCSVLIIHAGTGAGADEPVRIVERHLSAAGVRTVLVRQRGEPRVADVERAAEAARRYGCDAVVAVGGGSAMDCAKAVAGLLTNDGSPLDYMEVVGAGRRLAQPAAPWVAIPTTAGSGAEATRNAVIACPEKHFKASIRSEHLLARAAIIDPDLGDDVPAAVRAASALDALAQLIEAYTSKGATPLTDALSLEGMRLAGRSLRRAVLEADKAARDEMALAALLSGMALANAGLGAVHGFAAPLGAAFPVPHGAACAALLPHVLQANISAMRKTGHAGLRKYAEAGRALAGRCDLPDDAAIDECVRLAAALASDLAVPRLGVFGIAPADVGGLVELARKSSSMKYNPVELAPDVLADVLRRAL